MRAIFCLITIWAASTAAGLAAPGAKTCLLARQTPMLAVELYLGEDISGRAPVTEAEWRSFVALELAPRFPDGFTVIDGHGQWLDPAGKIGRESSRLVRIWSPPVANLAARVDAVAQAYKKKFHQEAVGVAVTEGCADFNG